MRDELVGLGRAARYITGKTGLTVILMMRRNPIQSQALLACTPMAFGPTYIFPGSTDLYVKEKVYKTLS